MNSKRKLLLNLKNIPGWTTKRKIVVLAVDDYGNIRIASKQARENLRQAGLNVDANRFDQYDSLENKQDLEQLFEVLSAVKDSNNNEAVFTAYSMSANIDFEAVKQSGYNTFSYELLPDTFNRLEGYEGVWDVWKQGMSAGLIVPQFHGREHLNLAFFNHLAQSKNKELIACIDNNSYGGFVIRPFKNVSYTGAFDFDSFADNENHKKVIEDGLNAFEKVYGFRATSFTAPGVREHSMLHETLYKGGIKYLDSDLIAKEEGPDKKIKKRLNYTGKQNKLGQTFIVRNSVFEPLLNKGKDSIGTCLAEIEIAFKWNKPAIVSSHRVNFSGHIEPKVREQGLKDLKALLLAIVKKWPDVEFMSADALGDVIVSDKK